MAEYRVSASQVGNTVSVLPSWELSGEGILANKARGPPGPRALLASIPSPLNSQLGNTGSISHLTSRNNQLIQLANISSITQSAILSAILETLNQLFILHLPPGSQGVWSCDVKLRDFLFQINLRATRCRQTETAAN